MFKILVDTIFNFKMNTSRAEDLFQRNNWTDEANSTAGWNSPVSSVGRFNWTVTGPLKWYGIVNITYLTIILLFTLLNILVLWMLQKTRHLRTTFNQLVSAMLLASILRSLTTVSMEIAEISSRFSIQNTAYCTLKVALLIKAHMYIICSE